MVIFKKNFGRVEIDTNTYKPLLFMESFFIKDIDLTQLEPEELLKLMKQYCKQEIIIK